MKSRPASSVLSRASCGSGSLWRPCSCFCWSGTSTTGVSPYEGHGMSTPTNSPRSGLGAVLESSEPRRRSFLDYRSFIRNHYDGLPGALTAVTGLVTGHEALAGRLLRPGAFDIRGCKRILDAACGNGRYSRFLLRHADPDAVLTAFDLSPNMLRRARARLRGGRV